LMSSLSARLSSTRKSFRKKWMPIFMVYIRLMEQTLSKIKVKDFYFINDITIH
jgi:hypothetical protein